jgi:hypothetical protein
MSRRRFSLINQNASVDLSGYLTAASTPVTITGRWTFDQELETASVFATGVGTNPTGEAMRIAYSSGVGYLDSRDFGLATYKPMSLRASSFAMNNALTVTNGIVTDGLEVNGNADVSGSLDILGGTLGNTHFGFGSGSNYITHATGQSTYWRNYDGVSTYTTLAQLSDTAFNVDLEIEADGFRVSNTSSTSQMGISLYDTSSTNPTYGIMFTGTSLKEKHGFVDGDWATYLTMNSGAGRGWVFRENTNGYNVFSCDNRGQVTADGFWRHIYTGTTFNGKVVQGIRPGGASSYYSTAANVTGYLRVQLPPNIANSMLGFEVHGYNYHTEDTQWGVRVSNYAQSAGGWHTNYAITTLYGNPPFDRVHFYDDSGDDHWVIFGTSTTNFNHPQIEIRNVLAGYAGGEGAAGDWNLSISASLPTGAVLKRGPLYCGGQIRWSQGSNTASKNLGGRVTIGTSAAAGGQDGDIHFKY